MLLLGSVTGHAQPTQTMETYRRSLISLILIVLGPPSILDKMVVVKYIYGDAIISTNRSLVTMDVLTRTMVVDPPCQLIHLYYRIFISR